MTASHLLATLTLLTSLIAQAGAPPLRVVMDTSGGGPRVKA
jgi:hypothetical protein